MFATSLRALYRDGSRATYMLGQRPPPSRGGDLELENLSFIHTFLTSFYFLVHVNVCTCGFMCFLQLQHNPDFLTCMKKWIIIS